MHKILYELGISHPPLLGKFKEGEIDVVLSSDDEDAESSESEMSFIIIMKAPKLRTCTDLGEIGAEV